MDESPGRPERGVAVAAWAALLLGLALVMAVVARVLLPFYAVILLSFVTVGLLQHPFERLTGRLGGRRAVAAMVICLLLVVAVVVPLVWTVVAVSNEAVDFYQMTVAQISQGQLLELLEERQPSFDEMNRVLAPFGASVTADKVYRWMATQGVKVGAFLYSRGLAMAGGLARLLLGFLLWVIVVYYLLVDGERLHAWVTSAVPVPAAQVDFLTGRFTDMAGALVLGNGVAGVIQGLGGGVVFALLDLPTPVMWGVVMGVLAFIPVIGISLVYIPGAVILLLAGDPTRAMLLLAPLMVLATVVEYWLKPLFVGRRVHMHPVLVALSLLGGFEAFGPIGLLVGPLTMMAFLALVEIFRRDYRPGAEVRFTPAAEVNGHGGGGASQEE